MSQATSFAHLACRPDRSRGRRVDEAASATRSCFQRDRDRILHSAAFRRLQFKTQVFVYHEGDHYRSRLTHSLEVGQIARAIARTLGLDEDLSEALALAHDLGHTPFGHAGEDALDAAMAPYGGFDHNAQTLRILTKLERRYAEFDGLNLCWETLEGVVKHNGPLVDRAGVPLGGLPLPAAIAEYVADHDLELASHPSAEAQVAALSDDIAYNAHDVEDGIRAGMFDLGALAGLGLAGPAIQEVADLWPGLDEGRRVHEVVRRLYGAMVEDLVTESRARLSAIQGQGADAVRGAGAPVIAFSASMAAKDRELKDFLRERMYRHHRVNRMTSKARRIVTALFDLFQAEPEILPTEWRARAEVGDPVRRARQVADFIAGMTDRYAIAMHRQLFDPTV